MLELGFYHLYTLLVLYEKKHNANINFGYTSILCQEYLTTVWILDLSLYFHLLFPPTYGFKRFVYQRLVTYIYLF